MLEQRRSEGHPGVRSGEGGEVRGGGTGIGVRRNSAQLPGRPRCGRLVDIGPHT